MNLILILFSFIQINSYFQKVSQNSRFAFSITHSIFKYIENLHQSISYNFQSKLLRYCYVQYFKNNVTFSKTLYITFTNTVHFMCTVFYYNSISLTVKPCTLLSHPLICPFLCQAFEAHCLMLLVPLQHTYYSLKYCMSYSYTA